LEGPLAAVREAEIRLLTDIATTIGGLGDEAQADRQRLLDVAQDLRDMFFLVVVIGEFNAGKSTLINALLRDNLLPTGVTPTTEMIELIRHGDTIIRTPKLRDDGIREWAHPDTGAPGVAIVDTPGTGSVFQKHETTAKAFLHRSDLVVFVISAKRALAETERLYLELAKDYGKKIILVVNQIDLLPVAEQSEVRRFVEKQVDELLDMEPLLFMVSAKEALRAKDDPGVQSSPGSLDAVRAHLRGVYDEAPPAKQKLLAQLDMAQRVIERQYDKVKGKADLVSIDTNKVREVQTELEKQSSGLDTRLREAENEVHDVLDGIRRRGVNFIDTNLSLRKIGRSMNRENLQAEFQEVVIGRSVRDVDEATSSYVNAVIDFSRVYWRGVIDRLNQLKELMEQELSGLDSSVYAEQRESLQEAIHIAERELKSYSTGQVVTDIQRVFQNNMNGFKTSALAAVSGLIMTILALAAPGPVLGAGALLTATLAFVVGAPVAALGGLAAVRYSRRVSRETKQDFNGRVDQLKETFDRVLRDLTQKERNRLNQYGKQVLTPIFSRLDVLAQRYAKQQAALDEHKATIKQLREQIGRITQA
jgi:small GTP-binding protein